MLRWKLVVYLTLVVLAGQAWGAGTDAPVAANRVFSATPPWWELGDAAALQEQAAPALSVPSLPSAPVYGATAFYAPYPTPLITNNVLTSALATQLVDPWAPAIPIAVQAPVSYFAQIGVFTGYPGVNYSSTPMAPMPYFSPPVIDTGLPDVIAGWDDYGIENPEPGTFLLLGGGILAVWLRMKRRSGSNEPDEVHSSSGGGSGRPRSSSLS